MELRERGSKPQPRKGAEKGAREPVDEGERLAKKRKADALVGARTEPEENGVEKAEEGEERV